VFFLMTGWRWTAPLAAIVVITVTTLNHAHPATTGRCWTA
jgi:hypothetical protein